MSPRLKFLALLAASAVCLDAVVVNNATDIQNAIISVNNGGGGNIIQFGNSISYAQLFQPLNADNVLQPLSLALPYTIDGQGFTLSQTGTSRGFFARGSSRTVTIQNLTIDGAQSNGGTGGTSNSGGGGGLGAGAAIFVNTGATVIIDNVNFTNNQSTGGNGGGTTLSTFFGGAGGAGFEGAGGNSSAANSSAGGGGGGFNGSGGSIPAGGFHGGGGGGGFNGNGGTSTGTGGGGGGGGGFNGGDSDNTTGGGGAGDAQDGFLSSTSGNGGDGSGTGTGGAGVAAGGGGGSGAVLNTSGSAGGPATGGAGGSLPGGGGGGGAGAPLNPGGAGGTGGSGFGGGGGGQGSPAGDGGSGGFGGGGGGAARNPDTPVGAVGGAGGDFGGGGGGASSTGDSGNGGPGGFGGGGGAGGGIDAPPFVAGNGGDGGFGGGGGGAGDALQSPGTGGFGAGDGGSGSFQNEGGPGAALGGAIFIQDGGTLNIQTAVSFSGSAVTAGTGATVAQALGTDVFIMSGGLLSVDNLSVDSEVPNPIASDIGAGGGSTSAGGLTVDSGNTAIFTINGANTYSGVTTVNSGSLYVQGSVITPVIVNGGTFGGNATLIVNGAVPNSGDLTVNGGQLSPGGDNLMYGFINVGNNLLFNAGSTFYDAEVDSVGNTDIINVTGTATLTGNLAVQAVAGNFLVGDIVTILTASGGVIGTFSNHIIPNKPDGTPLFEVIYSANMVQLLVIDNMLFMHQNIDPGNPQHVEDNITCNLPIASGSDLGFAVNVLGLLSDEEVNKALNLMHPAAYGTLEWMNLNNSRQVLDILSAHTNELSCSVRACRSNAPGGKKNSFWIAPFGNWSSQDQKGQLRGYNSDSVGFVTGLDHCFSNMTLGFGAGYTYTNYRWKGSAGKGMINQAYGALYGSYYTDFFQADLATTLGGNNYNADRYIRFEADGHPGAVVDTTAHASYTGMPWSSRFGLLSDLNSWSIPLQLFTSVDYFYLHQPGFRESRAGGLSLDVGSKTSNMLQTEIGASLTHTFTFTGGCWAPYASIGWVAKMPLSGSTYDTRFRGQPCEFRVNTTSKGLSQISSAIGAKVTSAKGFSLLVDAQADLNGRNKSYFANMRLECPF